MDKKSAYGCQQQSFYYLLLFERFLLVFQFKILATGFDPWVRKLLWRRKWQPLHYSCLEYPTDRGAWQTTAHGVAQSQTRLSDFFTVFLIRRVNEGVLGQDV